MRGMTAPIGRLTWAPGATIAIVAAMFIAAALRRSFIPEVLLGALWGAFGFLCEPFSRLLAHSLADGSWLLAALLLLLGFGLPSLPVVISFDPYRLPVPVPEQAADPPNKSWSGP